MQSQIQMAIADSDRFRKSIPVLRAHIYKPSGRFGAVKLGPKHPQSLQSLEVRASFEITLGEPPEQQGLALDVALLRIHFSLHWSFLWLARWPDAWAFLSYAAEDPKLGRQA